MKKTILSLAALSLFAAASPALADTSYPVAQESAVSNVEGELQGITPPRRRCFVRDRFYSYRSLRGCYRNSPRPRGCRQVCR